MTGHWTTGIVPYNASKKEKIHLGGKLILKPKSNIKYVNVSRHSIDLQVFVLYLLPVLNPKSYNGKKKHFSSVCDFPVVVVEFSQSLVPLLITVYE